MKQLIEKHFEGPFKRSVTVNDVRFVRDHSGEGSKLRLFFLDFIIANFSNKGRVNGHTVDWDELLLDYSDLRLLLLVSFRTVPSSGQTEVQSTQNYFENLSSALMVHERALWSRM